MAGKIKTLFSDKEKTEPLFPRTKTSAVSADDGTGLDVLLSRLALRIPIGATITDDGYARFKNSEGTTLFSLFISDPPGDNISVQTVTLDYNYIEVKPGASVQLSATILPEDATIKTLEWYSSNEQIATVDNTGLVNGIAEGSCSIVATSASGAYAQCDVAVKIDAIKYLPEVAMYSEYNSLGGGLKVYSDGGDTQINNVSMYNVDGAVSECVASKNSDVRITFVNETDSDVSVSNIWIGSTNTVTSLANNFILYHAIEASYSKSIAPGESISFEASVRAGYHIGVVHTSELTVYGYSDCGDMTPESSGYAFTATSVDVNNFYPAGTEENKLETRYYANRYVSDATFDEDTPLEITLISPDTSTQLLNNYVGAVSSAKESNVFYATKFCTTDSAGLRPNVPYIFYYTVPAGYMLCIAAPTNITVYVNQVTGGE